MNNDLRSYACYNYDDIWWLIEMEADCPPSKFPFDGIHVPEEGLDPSGFQEPYLRQYLNKAGDALLCPLEKQPTDDEAPCRVAFFICKTGAQYLRTPYGLFDLYPGAPLPKRLKRVVVFQDDF